MADDQHATNVSLDARVRGLQAEIQALHDLLDEKDRRYEVEFTNAREAVKLAHQNFIKWQEHANEWRQAMTDKDRNFVTKNALWGYILGASGLLLTIMILLQGLFRK